MIDRNSIQERSCVVLSNYGDDSIALIQWLYEADIKNVKVVYVETGFAAIHWKNRVEKAEQYVKNCGFDAIQITAPITFQEASVGRGEFPCSKFQWCTGILKGLPFLDWLEKIDLYAEAIVLMPKRNKNNEQLDLHNYPDTNSTINEWITRSPHHNERTVWHPLFNTSIIERNALLHRAGFKVLKTRSLECHPCVNSVFQDIASLNEVDIQKVQALEVQLKLPFFKPDDFGGHENIRAVYAYAKQEESKRSLLSDSTNNKVKSDDDPEDYLDKFYQGCGNHFGCGL